MQKIQQGLVLRFFISEDGLIMAGEGQLNTPTVGGLRQELLKEMHDSPWAEHPRRNRMVALMFRSCYWSPLHANVEMYVKTCLTCQQDKVE